VKESQKRITKNVLFNNITISGFCNTNLFLFLVNKVQEAGYYEVEFSSQRSNVRGQIASGIYLYRIEVIGKGNIPVYSDMKKMILLK
jgi:hypothetical protein